MEKEIVVNCSTGEQTEVDFDFIPYVPTIDELVEQIESKYNVKFEALQKRLNNVFLSDGINQEAKTIILQNEYKDLIDQKDLELIELFGGM